MKIICPHLEFARLIIIFLLLQDLSAGGGAWHFRYGGSIPACLFKYDIENNTVLYAGYLMRDGMSGAFQIEKTDQE